MKINKHEEMFEKLCAEQKLKFKRISASCTKTPDYVLCNDDGVFLVAVEIKALNKTGLDKDIEKKLESIFVSEAERDTVDDSVIFEKTQKNTSIRRIREYVSQANDQFRHFKQPNIPGILVLYSERISTGFEIGENLLDRSTDGDSWLLVDQSLGGVIGKKTNGRTLRPNKNQLVSAVIAPQESGEIIVKVNDYANIPFPRNLFKNIKII